MELPMYRLEDFFFTSQTEEYVVFIAILWNYLNQDRRSVYEMCIKNLSLGNLIAPSVVIRAK